MKRNVRKTINFIKDKKWWFIILIVVALVAWRWQVRLQSEKEILTFEKPIYQDLTKTLDISGILDAKEKARLRFAAGGKIVYLGAKEGDWVKKWQTIATIDQADLQKRLEKDLNLYMKERWDWDQQLDDIEDRTIDKEEERSVDKNQWDLENTVLDVEIRDISIHNTYLSSPIEGVLIESPTDVSGIQLLATDAFEVVNPNSLIFRGLVDESDISLVKNGQKTKITLDSFSDKDMYSHVSYIAFKSTETTSGTSFIVEFPIASDGSLNNYRLGMNGDAEIELETKYNVLTIPIDAVRERDDQVFVDIKTGDDKYEEREIKIGMETEDYVEVISGLSESDAILIPE